MPCLAKHELPFAVQVGRRHLVVNAVASARIDQVELRHDLQRLKQRVGHQPHLGAEPAEDPADLLRLARPQIRELGRLLRDRGRLDIDRLIGGAGALD